MKAQKRFEWNLDKTQIKTQIRSFEKLKIQQPIACLAKSSIQVRI